MNPGMANLTPQGQAYRLAPHGLKFEVPIKLELPVDEALFPQPGEHAVGGYFYNDRLARWESVELLSREEGRIVSLTDHFTDFVSATIPGPTAPGASAFTPTSIGDVPAPHPFAGIANIAPPAPNATGAAHLSYSLGLPPGRGGMQPSLGLSYSSNGSAGWLGKGWNLPLSSIEVDTRYGVPDFDGDWTQASGGDDGVAGSRSGKVIYQLDGSPLRALDATGRRYEPRVSGTVRRILRLDAPDGTGAKYFEVTDPNGTKYVYGRSAAARLADPARASHVGRWHLEEIIDRFGNGILYEYEQGNHPVGRNGAVTAVSSYPTKISYTTHNAANPGYEVTFVTDASDRDDVDVSARFGFLTTDPKLLHEVKAAYVGDGNVAPIRSYKLEYRQGFLGKPLLERIRHFGPTGAEFNSYRFTYTETTRTPQHPPNFSEPQQWVSLGTSGVTSAYAPNSHSDSTNRGGGGVSFFGAEVFGGSGWGGNSKRSAAYADGTGDGVSDFLMGSSIHDTHASYGFEDTLRVRRDEAFVGTIPDSTQNPLGDLGKNKRNGWEFHGHFPTFGLAGLELEGNVAEVYDKETETLADMNGDGLPDLIKAKNSAMEVYFNIGGRFADTPATWNNAVFESGLSDGRDSDAENEALALSFPVDPIVAWKAPFTGTILIHGPAQREQDEGDPVSVFVHGHDGSVLWQHDFLSSDMIACGPGIGGGCGTGILESVQRGEWIYFRASSIGAARRAAVLWTPRIAYLNPAPEEIRPYGLPARDYEMDRDFRVAGAPQPGWASLGHGEVEINTVITKEGTPDHLELRLFSVDISDVDNPVRSEIDLGASGWSLPQSAGTFSFALPSLAVTDTQTLELVLESDFMVDPASLLEVDARVRYLKLHRLDPDDPDAAPNPRDVVCSDSECTIVSDPTPDQPIPIEFIDQTVRPRQVIPVFEFEFERDDPPITQGTTSTVAALLSTSSPVRPGLVGCQAGGYLLDKTSVVGTVGDTSYELSSSAVPGGEPLACSYVLPAWPSTGPFNPGISFEPIEGVSGFIPPRILVWDQAFRDHSGAEDDSFGRTAAIAAAERSSLVGGFHRWFYGDWNGSLAFDPNLLKASLAFDFPDSADAPPEEQPPTSVPIEEVSGFGPRWGLRGGGFIEAARLNPGSSSGLDALRNSSGEAEVRAIRESRTYNWAITQGLGGNTDLSLAGARTMLEIEFVDMNGDSLPDIVTESGVRYNLGCQNSVTVDELYDDPTLCNGGFTEEVNSNVASGLALAETRFTQYNEGGGGGGKVEGQMRSQSVGSGQMTVALNASFSVGFNYGQTSSYRMMSDINGDGLADYLSWTPDAPGTIQVRLNLGYELTPWFEWDIDTSAPEGGGVEWRKKTATSDAVIDIIDRVPLIGPHTGIIDDVNAGSPNYNDLTSSSIAGGGSVNVGSGAWGIGIGANHGKIYSMNRKMSAFVDVTGDGRPDYVQKFPTGGDDPTPMTVRRNLGHRFGAPETWEVPSWGSALADLEDGKLTGLGMNGVGRLDVLGYTRSKHSQTTISGSVCLWFIACARVSYTNTSGKTHNELDMRDVNGDGFTDFVLKLEGGDSSGSGTVFAKMNQLAGLDLLQSISSPTGQETFIEYEALGHTAADPGDHYVVTSVTLDAGSDDFSTPISYETEYTYGNAEFGGNGKFDRDERKFLGFSSVTAVRPDGSTVTTEFENEDYYARGLPLRKEVVNEFGALYMEEELTYAPHDELLPLVGAHRPHQTDRTVSIYEGQSTHVVSNTEHRVWDPDHGQLRQLTLEGDAGTQDDLIYTIDYAEFGMGMGDSNELFAVQPDEVVASSVSGVEYRRREASYDSMTGALDTVTNYVTELAPEAWGPRNAATTVVNERDAYGNPTEITDPNDYKLFYGYDDILHTHITSTRDSFGYESSGTPNYWFGMPESVVDINGNTTLYYYDDFGRLTTIRGPDDLSGVPTVKFEYSLAGRYGPLLTPAGVVTRQKDIVGNDPSLPESEHNFIESSLFVDGLGRVVQQRRDHLLDDGTNLTVGQTISGKVEFDQMGRVALTGQPTFLDEATAGPIGSYIFGVPMTNPTHTAHDLMGRVTLVSIPYEGPHDPTGRNRSTIHYTYGVTTDSSGQPRLETKILDANDNESRTLRNARGFVVKLEQKNTIGDDPLLQTLETTYGYDPLGELRSVTDDQGNVTSAAYNTMGQMVALYSPDSGFTTWKYDLVGNMTEKTTDRLRAMGQQVSYEYQYNRLTRIDYVDAPDTTFTYGQPWERGDAFGNVAGRMKREVSEAGQRDMRYDRLGNVVESKVAFKRTKDEHLGDYSAGMQYEYDAFGRLLKTRFLKTTNTVGWETEVLAAGDEVVTYNYDEGGNLQSVFGQNRAVDLNQPNVPHHTDYVMHIGYNEFGQRSRYIAGNFAETTYSYQPTSRRLASVRTVIDPPDVSPSEIRDTTYEYDRAGNITLVRKESINPSITYQEFTYDHLHQLRTADASSYGGSESHYNYWLEQQYDELGNIILKDQVSQQAEYPTGEPGPVIHDVPVQSYKAKYSYDGPRPHASTLILEDWPDEDVDIGQGEYDFQRFMGYDQSGNQTWSDFRGENKTITWTADDKVRQIQVNGQVRNRTLYNGGGEKTVRSHPDQGLEQTAYMGGDMSIEGARQVTKHIYVGGQRVASKMDPDWFGEPSVINYDADHIGTAQYSTNNQQALVQHDEYFPSGEIWISETNPSYGLVKKNIFSGKEFDPRTGLYDYGARLYNPRQGQWISPDPAYDGLNRYAYVHNNPVNLVDPFGLSAETNSWTNHYNDENVVEGPGSVDFGEGGHIRGPGGAVNSSLPQGAAEYGGRDVSGAQDDSLGQQTVPGGGYSTADYYSRVEGGARRDLATPIESTVSPVELAMGGLANLGLRLAGRAATPALNALAR